MDLYEEFGVLPTASLEEIHKAYRKLVRQHHPDNWPSGSSESAAAEERMRRINELYAVLSDPTQRAQYDENARCIRLLQEQGAAAAALAQSRRTYFGRRWLVPAAMLGCLVATIVVFTGIFDDGLSLPGSPQARAQEPAPPRTSRQAASRGGGVKEPLAPPEATLTVRGAPSHANLSVPVVYPSVLRPTAERPVPVPTPLQPPTVVTESVGFEGLPEGTLDHTTIPAPPPARNPFAGVWIFTPKNAPPTAEQFAAEYIELNVRVESGMLYGSLRGTYNVKRSTLRPRVQFRFEGNESDVKQGFPWRSETGSEGMIKLHLLPGNQLEIGWYATKFAVQPELISGNAVLTGDQR